MVAHEPGPDLERLDEAPDLHHDLRVGLPREPAGGEGLPERQLGPETERAQADEVGIDGVQDPGRLRACSSRELAAPQAGHEVLRELEARLDHPSAGPDVDLGGRSLLDAREEGVGAGLHPDVDAGKAELPVGAEVVRGPRGERRERA